MLLYIKKNLLRNAIIYTSIRTFGVYEFRGLRQKFFLKNNII